MAVLRATDRGRQLSPSWISVAGLCEAGAGSFAKLEPASERPATENRSRNDSPLFQNSSGTVRIQGETPRCESYVAAINRSFARPRRFSRGRGRPHDLDRGGVLELAELRSPVLADAGEQADLLLR